MTRALKFLTVFTVLAGFSNLQGNASSFMANSTDEKPCIKFASPKATEDADLYKTLTGKNDFDASIKDGRGVVFSNSGTVAWRLGAMPIGDLEGLHKDTRKALASAVTAVEIYNPENKDFLKSQLRSSKYGLASVWSYYADGFKFDQDSSAKTATALNLIMRSYDTELSIQVLPEAQHWGTSSCRIAAGCLQYLQFPLDEDASDYQAKKDKADWVAAVYKAAGFTCVTGDPLIPFASNKSDCQLWLYDFKIQKSSGSLSSSNVSSRSESKTQSTKT